jgi:hypothetical protein
MSESRPLSSLRHRRCPSCSAVRPANDFRREPGTEATLRDGRVCPQCETVVPLQSFVIVERPEHHQEEPS